MTLQDFFDLLSANPFWILIYFIFIPLTALIAGLIGKGEGHYSPWKYLYSALIYMVCIPGIFAITLDLYLVLFEGQSIMKIDLFTQIVPIISMILTLVIIRWEVNLDYVPGFGKLSGLILIIAASLGIMWFVDRTRILVFSYVPVQYVLLIFVALLVIIRIGFTRVR